MISCSTCAVVFGALALILQLHTATTVTLVEGRDYLPFLKFPATDSPVYYPRDTSGYSYTQWEALSLFYDSGFPIESTKHRDIYICGCGLITIGIQLENYNYRDIGRFPLQSYYFTYSDETEYGAVIAPFWLKNEELSTRISTVGYEVHTSDGGEESANLLQRVSSFISNSSFLKSRTDSTETEPFSGTWMAVVHWDKLIPLIDTSYSSSYHYSDRERVYDTNTFQALLVTDGTRSYVVFSYRCGYMSWSEPRAVVGYDIRFSNYTNHPFNNKYERTHLISCLNYPDSEWSNVVYQLGPEVPNVTYTASDKKTPPAPSNLSSNRGYCAAAGYTGCCGDATEELGDFPFLSCRGSSQACYCDQQCYPLKDCCVDAPDTCPYVSSRDERLGATLGSVFGVTLFLLVVFVSLLLVLSFCGPLGRIYTKVATGGVVDA